MEGVTGRSLLFYDAEHVSVGAVHLQREIETNNVTELGFDQEFSQIKEGNNTPKQRLSLIQLSTDKVAYLFHVHNLKEIPEGLLKIIKNDKIVKIGYGMNQDYHVLYSTFGIQSSFLDLQLILQLMYKRTYSLQDAVSMLCTYKITKKHSGSNWAWEGPIDDSKKRYAAEDAFACLDLWKVFSNKLGGVPSSVLPIISVQQNVPLSDEIVEREVKLAVIWFSSFPTPRDVSAAEKQLQNSYGAWQKYPSELKLRLCRLTAEKVISNAIYSPTTAEVTKNSSRISPPKSSQKKRYSGSSDSSGSDKELSTGDVPDSNMKLAKTFLSQFHPKDEPRKKEAFVNQITNSMSGLSIKHFPPSSVEKRRAYAIILVAAMIKGGYLAENGMYASLTKKM